MSRPLNTLRIAATGAQSDIELFLRIRDEEGGQMVLDGNGRNGHASGLPDYLRRLHTSWQGGQSTRVGHRWNLVFATKRVSRGF